MRSRTTFAVRYGIRELQEAIAGIAGTYPAGPGTIVSDYLRIDKSVNRASSAARIH